MANDKGLFECERDGDDSAVVTNNSSSHEKAGQEAAQTGNAQLKDLLLSEDGGFPARDELSGRATPGIDLSAYTKAMEPATAALRETIVSSYKGAFNGRLLGSIQTMATKMPIDGFAGIAARIPKDSILQANATTKAFSDAALSSARLDGLAKGILPVVPAIDAGKLLPSGFADSIANMGTSLGEYVLRNASFVSEQQRITVSILDYVKPQMTRIENAFRQVDVDGIWEGFQSGARNWGGFGWVILRMMPLNQLRNCPNGYQQANRIGMAYARQDMDRLRRELPTKARKSKDVAEMLDLYDEGHLKPCAMMACSLIEGEFNNWAIRKTGNRNTRKRPKNMQLAEGYGTAQATYAMLLSVVFAFHYFFKNADGFSRSLEGELNRHILMHGMMNKKVTKTVCVKLFLLLDAVIDILPLCKIGDSSLMQ